MKKMKKNNTDSINQTGDAVLLQDGQMNRFSKLKAFLDRNGYIGCSFIIPFAILWMIFIALRVFPFGPNSVLILDLNGQYVYFFEALRKAVFGDASLLYSWSRSLGGEFLGIYSYYLASPLSYIVALFPAKNITEALLLITLLKCGFSGATMSWYLRKTRPQANEMVTISIACLYALSSYAVVQAHNTMWIDALIWLPLVVYGTEMLIKEHKFVLLCVSLTMTVLSTFYIGYMVCLFIFLYFFYYYFSGSANDNNRFGEKSHFLKSLIRMGVAALTSLLASCIIIIPTYYSLSFGKTTFSSVDWLAEFSSRFDLIKFISKLFIGAYDTVRPEGLPFVYCGTIVLILLPLYFISRKVSLREKLGALAMMLFLVLSMNLSILDIIWHGMQKPNWLNYRYSFLLIFLMLVFAYRALEEIESIRIVDLGISAGIVVILLIIVQFAKYSYVDTFYTIWLTIICVVVFTALLMPLIIGKFKPIMTTVLAIAICVEAFVAGIINSNKEDVDVTYSPRNSNPQTYLEGYEEFMNRLRGITDLVQASDDSFYRMENVDQRKVCDNHAVNIRGISGSTSTLNKKTIKFLNRMGYLSVSHWSQYKGETELADSLLGIKYSVYTQKQQSELETLYKQYDYVQHNFNTGNDENKSMYAYKNNYALSLAYTVNPAVKDFVVSGYASPFDMMNELVTSMLGEDELVEVYKQIPYSGFTTNSTVNYSKTTFVENAYDAQGNKILNEYGEEVKNNIPYYSCTKKGDTPQLFFNFTTPSGTNDTMEVYCFLPTSYARSAKWECNGKSGTFYDSGISYIQNVGMLETSKDYTMTVTMEGDNLYFASNVGMFYYLDEAVYKDVMTKLAQGNYDITSFTESSFYGTVNASDGNTTVFTTIPYDEGWNIKVDGKKVDYVKTCDALIAFDLESEGEHTIEINYFPKALTYGIIFTCIGIIMFIGWIILDKKFFDKKRKASLEEFEAEKAKYKSAYEAALAKAKKRS